jgi:hypothetical protein
MRPREEHHSVNYVLPRNVIEGAHRMPAPADRVNQFRPEQPVGARAVVNHSVVPHEIKLWRQRHESSNSLEVNGIAAKPDR